MPSHSNKLPEELKAYLDEGELQELEAIWDEAGTSKRARIAEASDEVIEQKLQQVRARLGMEPTPEVIHTTSATDAHTDIHTQPKSRFKNNVYKLTNSRSLWLAAAAVLLITIGLSVWHYAQQPVMLTVPRAEMVETTLPDGSRVELNSGSEITYTSGFGNKHRSLQLQGEAYFEVAGGEAPFRIETHNAYVTATGTEFNVRSWQSEYDLQTSVALREGSIEFASLANPEERIRLAPGEFSFLTIDELRPAEPQQVSIEEITAWRQREFYFSDRPLAAIFEEIERRFDTHIDVQQDSIRQIHHSLYMTSPDDAENIIETITQSLGLEYRISEERFVVQAGSD